MARQLARRQRRERLAGVLIAVIGVAVLVVAILALRNPKQASTQAGSDTRQVTPSSSRSSTSSSASTSGSRSASTSSSRSKSAGSSSSSAARAIGSQPLIVLNDTTTANLASNATTRFEGGGWNVTTYNENYHNAISSTVAYYDPAVAGAKRAAEALRKQYPTIKRVAPRFAPASGGDPLPAGPIVVVLTADYSPN